MSWLLPAGQIPANIHIYSSAQQIFHALRYRGLSGVDYRKQQAAISHLCGSRPVQRLCQQDGAATALASPAGFHWQADACHTEKRDLVISLYTADCVPIFLWSEQPLWLAAVHVGWRGLYLGIIENIRQLAPPRTPISAWIGPAICASCYEVSADFRQRFIAKNSDYVDFFHWRNHHYHADLSAMCHYACRQAGIECVAQTNVCTSCNLALHSHRREPNAARNLHLFWAS